MMGLYASAYPCVGTMANGAFPCASKGKELACFSRVLKVSGREGMGAGLPVAGLDHATQRDGATARAATFHKNMLY
jgi:hypothetical protein